MVCERSGDGTKGAGRGDALLRGFVVAELAQNVDAARLRTSFDGRMRRRVALIVRVGHRERAEGDAEVMTQAELRLRRRPTSRLEPKAAAYHRVAFRKEGLANVEDNKACLDHVLFAIAMLEVINVQEDLQRGEALLHRQLRAF